MIAAAIIQASTNGPWAFLGTKIMLGIGLGFAQTSAPPLTTEIAHPRHRANVTNMFQAIWFWGAILSAVVTIGTLHMSGSWSWRLPVLFQAFFPGLQLIGLTFIPESPRWLISKNRRDEALAMLVKYHANGDTEDELVHFEFKEICTVIDQEREAEKNIGFMSFFKTKGNRHRLLICVLVGFMIQWAGNGRWHNKTTELCLLIRARHCLLLPCTYPDERRSHRSSLTSRYQPWPTSLECHSSCHGRHGCRKIWSSSTVAPVNQRHAGQFHHSHSSLSCFRRAWHQSRRILCGCVPFHLLWLLRHCLHATVHRVPCRDPAVRLEVQGTQHQLDCCVRRWLLQSYVIYTNTRRLLLTFTVRICQPHRP